jgi:hypothetical protein
MNKKPPQASPLSDDRHPSSPPQLNQAAESPSNKKYEAIVHLMRHAQVFQLYHLIYKTY